MYAIILSGGKQLKVEVGQKIYVEKLDAEVGSTYTFNDVENDFVEGIVFTAEGKYTITAVDKAGNKTTKTFYIDKNCFVIALNLNILLFTRKLTYPIR